MFLGDDGASNKTSILKYFQGSSGTDGRLWLGHWGDDDSTGDSLNLLKGGNVGINTKTPSYNLDYAGDIK